MKRRLLSAFLAVMMVLTMAPVAFAADDDGVKSYDELVTAISNASDKDTIKLANDITLTDTLSINKNVTLDGQGHTISGTVPSDKSFISVQIPNDGDFTMTNCVILPSGEVTPHAAINLSVNGKVSVTNCTFGAESDTAGYMYNGLEFSQTYAMGDTNITGNTFYGGAFRHNCISFYKMVENANINISDNNFVDLNWDTTNAIRVSNYTSANATITLNGNSYSTHGPDAGKNYAGLLIFQITKNNDDLTKLNVVVNDLKTDFDGQLYYTYDDATNSLTSENEAVFHGDDSIAKYFVAKVGDTYYKTLSAAITAAEDGQTVKMLNDTKVTEEISFSGKKITLDLNGKIITGEFKDNYSVIEAQGENGSLTLTDTSADKAGKLASNKYGISAADGGKLIVNSGTVEAGYAALSGNNTAGDMNFEVNGGTLTSKQSEAIYMPGQQNLVVNGGVINGGISARMGQITVNNGVINGMTKAQTADAMSEYWNYSGSAWIGDAIYVWGGTYNSENAYGNTTNVKIYGGTINGNAHRAIAVYDIGNNYEQKVNVTITDGKVSGDVVLDKTYGPHTHKVTTDFRISGGLFSKDVAEYCSVGWTTVSNTNEDTKAAYPYTIGVIPEIKDNEVKADVATGATNSTVDTEKITTEAAQNAATTVANTVATTKPIADKSELTENDKKNAVTALKNAGQVTVDADGTISKNVTVIKQTYLDVTATEYVIGDTDDTYRVTMDITPKYNLVAVATENNEAVDVAKGVAYLQGQYLMNAGKTEVTVTLPTQYANKKVYITHKDDVYIATADENGKITFTTNGFSPFTFTLSNPNVVAEVNGNAYKSLQDAVNAVENNGTIEIVGGNKDYTATISGSSKTIKVKNSLTNGNIKVTVNGESKTIKPSEDATFTYTKPSSGGSSGGSSSGKTTYKVTTSAVNNGGVNASPSSAEKGATITITLSPDKGYKLDKLTVTDGSGKTVSTVKKSDTVYTFTMPASAVKVGVSYVKATETPSKTKFNDVSANDWFASAVDYVTGKGMMNGTADNTFSPKANTTRGMVVTVLYRLENQPSTSAASFTDVASGAYYANAVAWANANGIVSGYGSGKFGPNDKVTREQLAAILYRYAQYKKYDVSGANSLDGYTDVQSVSSYAVPALQWANAAGVVTGKSGSKLDPKGNATRAEVAAMLMRFCENVK